VLLPALFLVGLASAASAETAVVDSGMYRISVRDKVLGTERFVYLTTGDSLVLTSWVHELVPGEVGADTLEKTMTWVAKVVDSDLRFYESNQSFLGQRLHRGIVMADTQYTSYTQVNDSGTGDVMVRPPGLVFIIDPQVFSLYDVICRNLHGRTFDRRELQFLALGSPDTSLVAIATDMGHETIRWAARPVSARKIHIADGESEFFLWVSQKGQMLRLSQPEYGMLVERVGPPVRPAPRRRSAG
jgi:hypothetical protein